MTQATILVIEDEPLVRMTVTEELEEASFKVLEASNAAEAFVLLQQHDPIQAIFTDIDMPGEINGLDLAWIVDRRWPEIEIVITSGQRMVKRDEMPPRALFFPKPYAHAPIVAALKRLLS